MFENPVTSFQVSTVFPLGSTSVTKEEIIEFATEFDPVFFHLDEEAAKSSMLGGLVASGFHTCGLAMKLICEGYLNQTTSQGAPGVDKVNWLAPLRPGDTMSGKSTVMESRRSKSRPDLLIVKFNFEFWNQDEVPILFIQNSAMFKIPAEARNT